jgi:glycosyltransferase involved in cell wall biosynthesis
MRVLVLASFNKGRFAPFILEQAEALKEQGCEIDYFGLQGKGLRGYLGNLPMLRRKIKDFCPDIIHAHYGLSGLFANLQRQVPVVTTYHGSDINDKNALPFSRMAIGLSAWNIFVSRRIMEIAKPKKNFSLLPCGIDLCDLQLLDKSEARQRMQLDANKHYVLFAGAFDNEVKNAPLALKTVEELYDSDVVLLELKGYSREEVTMLMCAADAFLMTSYTEGSPQVIKEALACGCPIVSVNVGDVKERVEGVEGCYVAETRDSVELAILLQKALDFEGKTNGRERVISDELDNRLVAQQHMKIFESIC